MAFATFVHRTEGICKEREYFCVDYENILDGTRILVWTELPFLMSSHFGRVKQRVLRNVGQGDFSNSENWTKGVI